MNFIAGDDVNTEANQQVLAEANTQVNTEISDRIGANLKQELFGDHRRISKTQGISLI